LDLPALAQIRPGDKVRVQAIPEAIDQLYEQTVHLLPVVDRRQQPRREDGATSPSVSPGAPPNTPNEVSQERRTGRRRRPSSLIPPADAALSLEFVPDTEVLRERFLLAEAVGGYQTLHDLLNVHSRGLALIRRYEEKVHEGALSAVQVATLEHYQAQMRLALERANGYLARQTLEQFSRGEIHELHDLLTMAATRDKQLTRVLGAHLIHEIEAALHRLNELTLKIQSVEQSLTGIFLVDSEVMFIPTNELIKTVNTIFSAVGNPYLSRNIDGVMLLAARNLLIQVVGFYSYYGKHQIYNLFQRGGASTSITAVTLRIRREIRKLFEACQKDNKLVLTRVMENSAREFDLSVEAIQHEAEEIAIAAVRRIIPPPPVAPVSKRTWWRRVRAWFH
jgi:hypothetical protein